MGQPKGICQGRIPFEIGIYSTYMAENDDFSDDVDLIDPVDVDEGDEIGAGRIIPSGTGQFTSSATWFQGDVEMTLISPSGRVISRSDLGMDVMHGLGNGYEEFTIKNPEPGTWQIVVYGAQEPEGDTEVRLSGRHG